MRIDANYATLVLNALCLEGLAASMRYSIYLLYWYKSTNTAAEGAVSRGPRWVYAVLSVLALLVQKYKKYKYCRRRRCQAMEALSVLALLVQQYKY